MPTPALTSFAGGELSPLLTNRTDLEKYKPGCQTLENMIVLPQGGATRRAGTEFIDFANSSSVPLGIKTRTISFARSSEISYILEFGRNYFRVYSDGSPVGVDPADITDWSGTESYIPGDLVKDPVGGVDVFYSIKAGINHAITDTAYWVHNVDDDDFQYYQVWTPWDEDEIFNLKFVRSADVMYIVHPDHEIHKLSSTGAADWVLEKVVWIFAPLQDENIENDEKVRVYDASANNWVDNLNYPTNAYVEYGGAWYQADRDFSEYEDYGNPSTNADWSAVGSTPTDFTAGSIARMVSSGLEFTADDVGKDFLIKLPRDDNSISESLSVLSAVTTSVPTQGSWNLVTHGSWTATIQLQRSLDGGSTWVMLRTYSSTADRNLDESGEEELENALYRVEVTAFTSGVITIDFNVEEPYYYYIYRIVNYVDANNVDVQLKEAQTLDTSATPLNMTWAWGAWGSTFGYPNAVSLYEERLILLSNYNQPLTIWTSRTANYESLKTGVLATNALIYTLSSDKVNSIVWAVSHTRLLIGTTGDEWQFGSTKLDEPLTPDNVQAKRQSTYGSENIQAILINNVVMFMQRGGRKLREMSYDYQSENFISPDLSVMAEHITSPGVISMAFQENPYPILWCVRSDGVLLGFTYEKEQQVFAWHRHVSTGTIESIAVIPNENEDELWISVKRPYTTSRFIERFKPMSIIDDIEDAWYLDSAIMWDGGDAVAVGVSGQTASAPFAFSIAGHGFEDDDKIRVITDPDYPTYGAAFPYTGEVFTVYDVAGAVFKIKNEPGSAVWTDSEHPEDFDYLMFEKVKKTFDGLDNYITAEVGLVADGIINLNQTVPVSAEITLVAYANTLLVGLPYTSILKPMNIESDLADGSSQARRKRITQLAVSFHNTVGGIIENDDGDAQDINFREVEDNMDAPIPLYSGYKKVDYVENYDSKAGITVKQDYPLPMTVLMMQPWIDTYN